MSIYSTFRKLAAEWHLARDRARTRRILGSLPPEIRKDFGWPVTCVGRGIASERI